MKIFVFAFEALVKNSSRSKLFGNYFESHFTGIRLGTFQGELPRSFSTREELPNSSKWLSDRRSDQEAGRRKQAVITLCAAVRREGIHSP